MEVLHKPTLLSSTFKQIYSTAHILVVILTGAIRTNPAEFLLLHALALLLGDVYTFAVEPFLTFVTADHKPSCAEEKLIIMITITTIN